MKLVFPKNYDITFEPDFNRFTFDGTEKILVEIVKPTSLFVLNAADVQVNNCHVKWHEKILIAATRIDKKKEELTIKLSEKISGKAEIIINFVGTLNDKLVGFYRSQYKDKRGRSRFLATTQFEAADARRAFPCWDEPEAKATFDVSVIAEGNLTAISNMPLLSKKRVGSKVLFKFLRTPVMSTYLLYVGVGEFEFLSGKLGKTTLRIITTKGKIEQGRLALEFTKKFLGFYQRYFGIKYPLPKLDMIAVPDFAAGAMENWGAITFRETILLYDPKSSSTETKQHIAEVISHEIAHQWFGNLVTMKWWNDLWLNESFATFMATKAVASFYPDWDLWDQFLKTEMGGAMNLDSLKSSHQINVEVKEPGQIREIFDEISYNKGGTILRMLENFLGEKNFRLGLTRYLQNHKYKNATTEDLWEALEAVSKKPVKKMMNSWISQVGYPLVEAYVRDSKLILRQKRFLLEKGAKFQTGRWAIPVSVRTKNGLYSKVMLKKSEIVKLYNRYDWFKINADQKGLYRVRYDHENLEGLKEVVREKKIDNVDRWGIQNDLFAFLLSGEISLKDYLDFVKSYFEEDDYLVTLELAENLNSLYLILSKERFWNEIIDYNKEFFSVMFERLGWDPREGEKHTDALLRNLIITSLGRLGDEQIIEEANRRFGNSLKRSDAINPDLRNAVYALVAWDGNYETYRQLTELYRKALTQEEKIRFLGALSSFKDKELLLKSLQFSLSREVRSQDMRTPIMRMANNPYGKDLIWPWMKKNWKVIVRKFGTGSPLLNKIIGNIAVVSDRHKEKEIAAFFRKNRVPGIEMKLAQTLERIRINSKFLERARHEFSI